MVSTGAGRYITDRWSIAVEAGNTWFLYDYRQKTIPNQYLPLDSNVSNLKNNLISAGVKVGFHPNENLSFYAGANHLNPFHSGDRKSTRLNSSHVAISYAVFCLKQKR